MLGETAEDSTTNDTLGTAQEIGNLLSNDRNTISLAGELSGSTDVDWYRFTVDYQGIQSIPGINDLGSIWATIFDIDYASGMSRPDLNMWVFDSAGRLILMGGNSNLADDRPDPIAGANVEDLSRGSVGATDPFIGTAYLPEGSNRAYYVAISSVLATSVELSDSQPLTRVEPLNSVNRVVSEHFSPSGSTNRPYTHTNYDDPTAIGQRLTVTPDEFHLSDVVMYVNTSDDLYTVDPFTGAYETDVSRTGNNWLPNSHSGPYVDYNDIAMRNDGELYSLTGRQTTSGDVHAQTGLYVRLDTGDARNWVTSNDTDIVTYEIDPASPTAVRGWNSDVDFNALEHGPDGTTYRGQRYVVAVGNLLMGGGNGIEYRQNMLYILDDDGDAWQYQRSPAVSGPRLHSDIIPFGQLTTTPTLDVPAATDRTSPADDFTDGLSITITDTNNNVRVFEFDSGPAVGMDARDAEVIRDGDTFMLNDGLNQFVYEFDSGPVLILNQGSQINDGDTVTIEGRTGTGNVTPVTRTYEFDRDNNFTGDVRVPYTLTTDATGIMDALITAVNGDNAFTVTASGFLDSPNETRISFSGDRLDANGLQITASPGMAMEGWYGLNGPTDPIDPAHIRVAFEETESAAAVGNRIEATVENNQTIDASFAARSTNSSFGDRMSFMYATDAAFANRSASATVNPFGDNNDIKFTATAAGPDYNGVSVVFNDTGSGLGDALATFTPSVAAWATLTSGAVPSWAILSSLGTNNDITVVGATLNPALDGVNIAVTSSGAVTGDAATVAFDSGANTLTIDVDPLATTANTVVGAIIAEGTFFAALEPGNNGTGLMDDLTATATTGGATGSGTNNDITLTANSVRSAYSGITVEVVRSGAVIGDLAVVTFNGQTRTLTIDVDPAATTAATVIGEINAEGTFSAALEPGNDGSGLMSDLSATATTGGWAGGLLAIDIDAANTTADTVRFAVNAEGTFSAALDFSADVTNDGTGLVGIPAPVTTSGGIFVDTPSFTREPGSEMGISVTSDVAIPFLAEYSEDDMAQAIVDAINSVPFFNVNASVGPDATVLMSNTSDVDISNASPPLTLQGGGGGGDITGLAYMGSQLYAVSETGGLYRINNETSYGFRPVDPDSSYNFIAESGGGPSLEYVKTVTYDGTPIQFSGLEGGPSNVEGGKYADMMFATDTSGHLYAMDLEGNLERIFVNDSDRLQLERTVNGSNLSDVRGVTFSPVDYNLWHMTSRRWNDVGHGVTVTHDQSRNGELNYRVPGDYSMYFGLEDPRTGFPTDSQPGASNYHTRSDGGDTEKFQSYNMPGGAHGSMTTEAFSLEGYDAQDEPVLYFTYFADTQGGLEYDGARVYISTDGASWDLIATNTDTDDGSRRNQGIERQMQTPTVPTRIIDEIVDDAQWRQARIDLSRYAGESELRLRFDFSTASDMEIGDVDQREEYRQHLLSSVDAYVLTDGDAFYIDNQRFEFDMGYSLVLPNVAGRAILDGEWFEVDDGLGNVVRFEFDKNGSVVETETLRPINISDTDSTSDVAALIRAAISGGNEVEFLSPDPALIMLPNDDGFSTIQDFGFTFEFYGNNYTQFYVNNNGNITFTNPLGQFTADGFPQNTPIVAPFWADVDTRGFSDGSSSGSVHLTKGTSPDGNPVVQIDWVDTGYYSTLNTSNTRATNSFTLYIEDNPAGDIVTFGYGGMEWTTGDASGGFGGFGGTGAQIGFDAGDGANFVSVGRPSSLAELSSLTSVGQYTFQIDPVTGIPDNGLDVATYYNQADDPNRVRLTRAVNVTQGGASTEVYIQGNQPGQVSSGIPVPVTGNMTQEQVAEVITQVVNQQLLRSKDLNDGTNGTVYTAAPERIEALDAADIAPGSTFSIRGVTNRGDYTTVTFGFDTAAADVTITLDPLDDADAVAAKIVDAINAANLGTQELNVTATQSGEFVTLNGPVTFFDPGDSGLVPVSYSDTLMYWDSAVGEVMHLYGHTLNDQGPLGYSGDPNANSGSVGTSGPLEGDRPYWKTYPGNVYGGSDRIDNRFNLFERGQDNYHEGFYIDDIIIGFAERGEMVTDAGQGTTETGFNFASEPDLDLGEPPIVVEGEYQLEIRRGPEYAAYGTPFPTMVIYDTFDTNDRHAQDYTLIVPAAADITHGQTFSLSDGLTVQKFVFLDTIIGGGGGAESVAIYFNAGQSAADMAKLVQQAVNNTTTLNVTAASIPTSERVDLFGAVAVEDMPNFLYESAIGDRNLYRENGQIIIDANSILNSSEFGIVVEPTARETGSNFAHPASGRTLDSPNNLVSGIMIENNLIAYGGLGGILFAGQPTDPNNPVGAIPFGRIVNNTIYGPNGVAGGTGIRIENNASPTVLNNILANFNVGILVDTSSVNAGTVLGASIYQNNGTNVSGMAMGDFYRVLLPTDPLFVDAPNGNFYLAAGSQAIDSSLNSLEERQDYFDKILNPVGIPVSPIKAPEFDLYGQLRDDDPDVAPPSGIGSNVFKDRGAIDRVDFFGPTSLLVEPLDNDASGVDRDPALHDVRLAGQLVTQFAIQLFDAGVGVNDDTVIAPNVQVYRDADMATFEDEATRDAPLVEGTDYFFNYNATNDVINLVPAAGIWPQAQYTIVIDNSGTGVRDGADNTLQANRFNSPFTQMTVFTVSIAGLDFGDAPDDPNELDDYPTFLNSDGARHLVRSGFQLGLRVDDEADATVTADATGDMYDDGVVFDSDLLMGGGPSGDNYVGLTLNASQDGFIDAWLDFNIDGDWNDAGEKFAVWTDAADVGDRLAASYIPAGQSIPVSAGDNRLYIDVPAQEGGVAEEGVTFARFRYSSIGGLGVVGEAPDGEVEDYQIGMVTAFSDFGDAPDTYKTSLANQGPRHKESDLFLGALFDNEGDAHVSAAADGDDLAGLDDEDGVTFSGQFIAGQTLDMIVNSTVDAAASRFGILNVWIDFNGNGYFADPDTGVPDPGEHVVVQRFLSSSTETIALTVPAFIVPGETVARFRLSPPGAGDSSTSSTQSRQSTAAKSRTTRSRCSIRPGTTATLPPVTRR